MFWAGLLLFVILVYIGFDYGRLIIENRRLSMLQAESGIEFTPYIPTKYIMIGTKGATYIQELAQMDIKAHTKAGIGIKSVITAEEKIHTYFENGDQLLVVNYDKTQLERLSNDERDGYEIKIFFDHKLPKGAERAVIEQLGLMDYMVNIGICGKKSGGK